MKKEGRKGNPTAPRSPAASAGGNPRGRGDKKGNGGKGEEKTWLTGITDGRVQQIHARGCETQAIDCIRWLLKIRHHAKVVAGRRVGRNPGEGEPPERPACPGRCLGVPSAGGGRQVPAEGRRGGGVRELAAPRLLSPLPSPADPPALKPAPSRIWEPGETEQINASLPKKTGREGRAGKRGGGHVPSSNYCPNKTPHAFNCPHCTAARGICIGFPAGHQLIVSSKT